MRSQVATLVIRRSSSNRRSATNRFSSISSSKMSSLLKISGGSNHSDSSSSDHAQGCQFGSVHLATSSGASLSNFRKLLLFRELEISSSPRPSQLHSPPSRHLLQVPGEIRNEKRWACPSRSGSTPHKSETVTGCCRGWSQAQ